MVRDIEVPGSIMRTLPYFLLLIKRILQCKSQTFELGRRGFYRNNISNLFSAQCIIGEL